jgi:hypothetical protein
MGFVDRLGYGRISVAKNATMIAHRASYRAFKGEIPDGMDVLHRCDVRPCVNPDHLFAGTHTDNMRDMVAKGRGARMQGEKHPGAIITDAMVAEMLSSTESHRQIARRLGISKTTVWDVRNGKTWGHVMSSGPSAYRPRLGKYGHYGVSKTNPTAGSSYTASFRGKYLGSFLTAVAAAKAFDQAAIAAGFTARLNFP